MTKQNKAAIEKLRWRKITPEDVPQFLQEARDAHEGDVREFKYYVGERIHANITLWHEDPGHAVAKFLWAALADGVEDGSAPIFHLSDGLRYYGNDEDPGYGKGSKKAKYQWCFDAALSQLAKAQASGNFKAAILIRGELGEHVLPGAIARGDLALVQRLTEVEARVKDKDITAALGKPDILKNLLSGSADDYCIRRVRAASDGDDGYEFTDSRTRGSQDDILAAVVTGLKRVMNGEVKFSDDAAKQRTVDLLICAAVRSGDVRTAMSVAELACTRSAPVGIFRAPQTPESFMAAATEAAAGGAGVGKSEPDAAGNPTAWQKGSSAGLDA